MSSVHPARRRAERFDTAIEDPSFTLSDPRMAELVDLVSSLRAAPQPSPRTAFTSDLRAQLMTAAETELVPTARTPRAPQRSKRERRIAVALGGLALVGATTSMAVAAQSALPGDTLYPLKRAIEDADTGLSADGNKGSELLDHASSRLRELDALSADGKVDGTRTVAITDTLDTFSSQAQEASDLLVASYESTGSEATITELRTFTGKSLDQLGRLEAELPTAVRPAVLNAAKVLFSIDQNAAELCPECAGTGITDVPGGLLTATSDPLASTAPTTTVAVSPAAQGKAPNRPGKARTPSAVASPSAAATTTQAALPDPTGGLLAGGDTSGKTTSADKSGLGTALGGLLGNKSGGGTTTTTGTGGGTPAASPLDPVASAVGEVVQGTVDSLNNLTGTLLNPPKP